MPTPPNLLLIRHAEAEHLVGDLTGGSTDSNLTDLGLRQARLLAERLAVELEGCPVHLGAGPLNRARRTAEIIGEALGIQTQIYPALTDLNIGAATGLSQKQAGAMFIPPSEPRREWRPYPGAENWRELSQRVRDFMEVFHSNKVSILVTHRAVIAIIIE
jgi:probable phosphoglycerate mutase